MKKAALFRGWYIVVSVHILLALSFGAAYSFGAFFSSIQTHFQADQFSTASIFSLTALIYYTVGAFSGSLSDRFSVRIVVGAGITLLALGFFVSSLLTSSITLFLIFFCVFVGLGVGLIYVPAISTIQRWFNLRRSLASGIALAGTGLGTFMGPMFAGSLMQHLSWQSTMQIFAIAIVLFGLPAITALRGTPQECGLHPDGIASDPGAVRAQIDAGAKLSEVILTVRFWYYFAAIFFGSIGLFLALIHINPYAQQHGLTAAQANLLLGLIGIGNIAGRLLLGRLGDKLGQLKALTLQTVFLSVLCFFWSMAHGFIELAAFAVLFGAVNGGCIALYPAVAATWFGTKNLGAILGSLYIAVGIAAVAGGSIGGLLFDFYKNYTASIILSGICALISSIALLGASHQPLRT